MLGVRLEYIKLDFIFGLMAKFSILFSSYFINRLKCDLSCLSYFACASSMAISFFASFLFSPDRNPTRLTPDPQQYSDSTFNAGERRENKNYFPLLVTSVLQCGQPTESMSIYVPWNRLYVSQCPYVASRPIWLASCGIKYDVAGRPKVHGNMETDYNIRFHSFRSHHIDWKSETDCYCLLRIAHIVSMAINIRMNILLRQMH